ncbi:MAG: DNA polymerase III subunit alpha [Bacilli bacterium]|nr:DNA polymerase III subunit alpha [Bacilli bacterium]
MNIPIKITTDYTLLSSLITLDKLISCLKDKHISSCGICDTNLFGSYLFYKKCRENNIKPIIGLEIKILDNSVYLYAKNYDGYKALLNINYISQEREVSLLDLNLYASNIIFVIPYRSRTIAKEFKDYIMFVSYENEKEKANIDVTSYKSLFIQDIKLIESRDNDYLNYLSLIKNGETVDDKVICENYSLEDFLNNKIIDDNNKYFVDLINIEFPVKPNYLPKYQTDKDQYKLLISLCIKGLEKRFHGEVDNEYKQRLNYELDVINKMGFVDYFLIVYDYVLYAKKNNIGVGPGRGSAAGSLVSYCLGITDIDPLKYNLLFERFLNPKRVTMPDIDIDFEDEKRYDVIKYVKDKYTQDKVGLIITYGTLGSKQALRDVARVLKIDDERISKLMKFISADLSLKDNYNKDVENILNGDNELKLCYKIASKIYGLKRHTSTHAAGVVISNENLKDIVPVLKTDNELVVGLTMNELEENGLLKMDFLGLKNISTIKEIVNNVSKKEKIDFNNIPLDDEKTYRLLKSGNTLGIFQFETSGMQNLLPKLKPSCFEDLIAAVALFRPGPIDNIDLYIKNKQNPDRIKYPHESLKSVLKETYGIIVYQEQIMQILSIMADYDYAEADNIRRAMSKKKEEILLKEKDIFINRSINKGYTRKIAEDVYNLILKFANYGFNKAHSVSYALIGYKMAYLKANYPDIFITTSLNIFGKAQVKCKEYLNEAQKFHLKIFKPLINKSTNEFIIKGINILLPFNQIIGISEEFSKVIVEERKNADYKSIFDFVRRIPNKYINKQNIEKLIKADVFRDFSYNQKTYIVNIDSIINFAEIAEGMNENEVEVPYLIIENDYTENELRLNEKSSYGFYVSNHPSSSYHQNVVKIENISKHFDKAVNMVLCIELIRTFKTKKNENMASIIASDETGEIELVIFPRNISLINNLIEGDIILVNGNVGKRYNDYQILVNNIKKKNK